MKRAIPAIAALIAAASCEGVFGIHHGDIFHDEDADGVDDSVDNCPADANNDQTLAENQHVGSACAFGSGDYGSAFFDAFPGPAADNLMQPGWQVFDGDWTHGSDTWDLPTALASQRYLFYQAGTAYDDSAIVEVHVSVGASNTSSGVGVYAGIPAPVSSSQPPGVVCQVRQMAGVFEVNTFDGSGTSIANAQGSATVGPGDDVRIVVTAAGDCRLSVNGGDDVVIHDLAPTGSGYVGLWTDSGTASYDSIVVYTAE
jgi:hypothetical protein